MVSSKKKKGLRFDFISDFPIFLPNSGYSLKKKKKKSSLPFALSFPYFRTQIRVFSKKKKVFTQNRPLNKHLQRIQNCMCCFRGGPQKKGGLKRLPYSPHPISTTDRLYKLTSCISAILF